MKLTEREKAYHNGYEQGRFDAFAERMGYDQAEKVKAKIDKQKNCPYCHGKMQSDKKMLDKTPDGSAWLDMADSGCFEYHIKGTTIFGGKKFKYCPFCRRPLNEEE